MRKKIVSWLKQQLVQAHAKGVVVGLSGGVDSCVVAALAEEAFGRRRVLALIMPCHSSSRDYTDARAFAGKFGIRTTVVDLSHTYDNLVRILPAADKMTQANLRPRLRMTVLYYFARNLNYLVCGTSNKSELATGYFTKHGDGASDILPIGDLLKRQVRKLAEELAIPRAIIDKPPTAGLWPKQTDEGDLGVTYPELDDVLARMGSKKRQVLPAAKVKRVKQLIRCSEHKRLKAAVCRI